MNIIEQYLQSKTPNNELCEDGIFVSDHFIAVVDGVTTKSKRRWDEKTSGKIATEAILSRLETLKPDVGAEQCMSALNDAIAKWYRAHEHYDEARINPVERCAASIVVYSRTHRQVWFVGDCQALVGREYHADKKLVDMITRFARVLYTQALLLEGKPVVDSQGYDIGRAYIAPLLEKQNYFQNMKGDSDFKYAALDGFFEDMSMVKIIGVPDNVREIVLASDGYPKLKPTLAESEYILQEILIEDPLLIRRYKSTKGLLKGNVSFDDRAYIRFTVA